MFFNFDYHAQSGNLFPHIDPSLSMGYTYWNENPSANAYKIETFTEDGLGNSILLNTVNTDRNYCRFSPSLFQVPFAKFKITALSPNGEPIDASDEIDCQQVGYLGDSLICSKTCVGISYAYKMKITQQNMTQYLQPAVLSVSPTHRFYDPISAFSIPYWQAFTTAAYSSLPGFHPYKVIGSGVYGSYSYKTIPISASTSPGPFLDRFNNTVTNGYLVEKKMDQFHHFAAAYTEPHVIIQQNDCGSSLNGFGGWVWKVNNLCTVSNYPTVANPFTNTLVHDLACLENVPPQYNEPINVNWNQMILDMKEEVKKLGDTIGYGNGGNGGNHPYINGLNNKKWEYLEDQIVSFSTISMYNGAHISGIVIKSLSNSDNGNYETVTFARQSAGEELRLIENSDTEMRPGLYQLIVYTSDNDVLPFYFDNVSSIDIPEDKEFLNLAIIPNPIVDNTLRIKIAAKKDMNCQLYVHDFNGNLIHSEVASIVGSDALNREVTIPGTSSSTQYIVTVVCPDGSTLQKFALKL